MAEEVSRDEYENHKNKCGKSFEDVFDKLNKMERAMFGEPEFKRKGVFDMTTDMYNSVMMSKGGEKIFWNIVKVSSGILAIGGAVVLSKIT